jgi:hypothetical protein
MENDERGSSMNIYQRINAVRKAINYIQKDKSVSAGPAGSYRAVTHDAVTGMVRQHLVEHGVIIAPTLIESMFHPKEEGAKQRLYSASYDVRFINMDAPDECVTIRIEAHALDNGDKAPGKAISYATKYAILKLFNIETGEDEESRYQREELDVAPFLEKIAAAESLDALKGEYVTAYTAAQNAGDKEACRTIMAAKDNRKKLLESA